MALVSGRGFVSDAAVLTADEITGKYASFLILPTVSRTDVVASSAAVTMNLVVPLRAIVTQAVARVAAKAPGRTAIGGIANVRPAAGKQDAMTSELVVDFGTLRTVSALKAPTGVDIKGIRLWAGTKFVGKVKIDPASGNEVTFTEVQTERLLVTLVSAIQPAAMASDGHVTTTTPPADLELAVAGGRVWFRAGPAPADFGVDVDVTSAVQAAVDAATAGDVDGNVAVSLTLTARVPGDLRLTLPAEPRFLRTHVVEFPDPMVPVPFADEGVADVALPLPADAPGWMVHRVVATAVPRDPGPRRVLPPDGPPISADADLLLDADRRLAARLPRSALARFERLVGIRLLLAPDAGGIEIGGSLLTGTADRPGAAVANAVLTPVTVPAGPRAWASLLLARPVEVRKAAAPAQEDHFWIAIAVTRGSARLSLAASDVMVDDDRAMLRRFTPNGLAKPLSVAWQRADPADAAVPVPGDTAALRLIGIAPQAAPVEVVSVDVPATDRSMGAAGRRLGPDGTVAVTLDPVRPHRPHRPLALRLTATAGGVVTLGPVVVAYTDSDRTREVRAEQEARG